MPAYSITLTTGMNYKTCKMCDFFVIRSCENTSLPSELKKFGCHQGLLPQWKLATEVGDRTAILVVVDFLKEKGWEPEGCSPEITRMLYTIGAV